MLPPWVQLSRHQPLIAGELPDISHWKQNTHFQLRIIVCFFVLYYFHFIFIPANPIRSSDFFFFNFCFGEEGIQQWRRAACPAEGVKSKAINERRVHLFGLVRITGTLAKWKINIPPLSEHIFHPQSHSPLKIGETNKGILSLSSTLLHSPLFFKHILEILGINNKRFIFCSRSGLSLVIF